MFFITNDHCFDLAAVADFRIIRFTVDVSDLPKRFAAILSDGRVLPDRKRPVVVAVSGGLDSMVLLNLLSRHSAETGWDLHVAHFNHRLRGRASTEDERFVRRQALKLGLPFHSARWDSVEKDASAKKHGVEMAARKARFRFLGEIARETRSKNIVLAHHADDQSELFFIRLLRGAGSSGLGGMRAKTYMKRPVGCDLIRPLLSFSRNELFQWAKENRIQFREDLSNQDTRFARNQIRHELLPLLSAKYSKGISRKVNQTMRILADEAEWWRTEARNFLENGETGFDALSLPLQRHVLVLQLEELEVNFDFECVEKLRSAEGLMVNVQENRLLSRNKQGQVNEHERSSLEFGVDSVRIDLSVARGIVPFGDRVIKWRVLSSNPKIPIKPRINREIFDLAMLGAGITLRHWRAGDRFQPIGMKKPSKLQNLFTNAKISVANRRRCIVAETDAGDVFWVEGLRIGELARVEQGTRKCLELQWVKKG